MLCTYGTKAMRNALKELRNKLITSSDKQHTARMHRRKIVRQFAKTNDGLEVEQLLAHWLLIHWRQAWCIYHQIHSLPLHPHSTLHLQVH